MVTENRLSPHTAAIPAAVLVATNPQHFRSLFTKDKDFLLIFDIFAVLL